MIVFRCDTLTDFRGVIETLSGTNNSEIKEILNTMADQLTDLQASVTRLEAGEAAQEARLTAIYDTQAAHIAEQDTNIAALKAEIEVLKANPGIDPAALVDLTARVNAVSDTQDAFKAATPPVEPPPVEVPPTPDPAG